MKRKRRPELFSDEAFSRFVEHALRVLYQRHTELNRIISLLQRLSYNSAGNNPLNPAAKQAEGNSALSRNRKALRTRQAAHMPTNA